MVEIGLNPNIFEVGGFTLAWHGLLTALAVALAVVSAVYFAHKWGVSVDWVYSTAVWGIVGGIVGARLVHVIDNGGFYIRNPLSIIQVWDGGVSLYGGLLGGFLVGATYARLRGYRVGLLANVAAPGMILAQVVGRIGCLINGDAYGTPTSLPWAVLYTHPNAAVTAGPWVGGVLVPGHPVPVYEIIWDLLVLVGAGMLFRKWRKDWVLFLSYMSLYALGRFFLSFIRGGEDPVVGPLHEAHVISLLVIVVAAPLAVYFARRPAPEPVESPEPAPSPSEASDSETG